MLVSELLVIYTPWFQGVYLGGCFHFGAPDSCAKPHAVAPFFHHYVKCQEIALIIFLHKKVILNTVKKCRLLREGWRG